ncbi:MAG: CvpA family protein [Pseudomonadota bacterium]
MNWGWVDAVFGSILLLSVVVGCMRGLVFEVMSLAGWVVAYAVAVWFAPQWAPSLPIGRPGSAVNTLAAYSAVFLGVLIVWGLTATMLRWLIHATPLSVIDRLFGGFFGLLRGALILLCVTTAVAFLPWSQSATWRTSPSAQWLNEALLTLRPWLPIEMSRFMSSARPKMD